MRILLSLIALLLASCATEPTIAPEAPAVTNPPVYAPAPPPPPAAPPIAPPAPPIVPAAPPPPKATYSPMPVYSAGSVGSATASTSGGSRNSGKLGGFMGIPNTVSHGISIPLLVYKDILPSTKVDDLKSTTARSYVIFTHRPEKSDKEVYESVCKHWTSDFESKEAVEPYADPNTTYIPFYWVSTVKGVANHNCNVDDLYAYDYGHAAAIISKIGKDASSAGPLLVLRNAQGWFVLDISKFDPIDVKRAFVIWKQQITRADLTQTKFTMVKMREYFRTLVEVYGDTILKSAEKAS